MKTVTYLCIATAAAAISLTSPSFAKVSETQSSAKLKKVNISRKVKCPKWHLACNAVQGPIQAIIGNAKHKARCYSIHDNTTLWNKYLTQKAKIWGICQQDYQRVNNIGAYDPSYYAIYKTCYDRSAQFGQKACPTADQWKKINGYCGEQGKKGTGYFANTGKGDTPEMGTFTKWCSRYDYSKN